MGSSEFYLQSLSRAWGAGETAGQRAAGGTPGFLRESPEGRSNFPLRTLMPLCCQVQFIVVHGDPPEVLQVEKASGTQPELSQPKPQAEL